MKAVVCPNEQCGFPLPPDAVLCPLCGTPYPDEAAEEAAVHVILDPPEPDPHAR